MGLNPTRLAWLVLALCVCGGGCHTVRQALFPDAPSERAKVSLPPYVIDPPDVLVIDALRLVPKPPYRLAPFDEMAIRFPAIPENLDKKVLDALVQAGRLVAGVFSVDPEGTINLGPVYGRVKVVDLTLEQARRLIETTIKKVTDPEIVEAGGVFAELSHISGMQQIRGEHLVRPDGTVSLGTYGSVYVAGMTLDEAKFILEEHLGQFMLKP